MTSQCPRCGAPRIGDFCHQCGLDFRTNAGQAMPPQQPLPPQQPIYNPAPPPQSQGYFTQQTPPAGYYPQVPQGPGYYSPPPPAYPAPSQWAPQTPAPTPQAANQPNTLAQTADAQATDLGQTADAGGQPATQPNAQSVNAPSVCLRCYAPLHPGYALCSNCGFDNTSAWGAAAAAHPAGVPTLAIALALLGACLIVAAGVLVFVAQSAG
jgi:hypothetical protein